MKIHISLFTGACFLASSVLGHHGFGRFDMNAEQQWAGILGGIEFVNPHSYVNFGMTLADGSIRHMGCEMRAATVLRRSGWSRAMFVEGAYIRISGRPHRDDPASCYVETIAIGDAPALERYQQLTDNSLNHENRPMRLASGEPNISGDWAQEQYLLGTLPNGRSAGLCLKVCWQALSRENYSAPMPRIRAGDQGLSS